MLIHYKNIAQSRNKHDLTLIFVAVFDRFVPSLHQAPYPHPTLEDRMLRLARLAITNAIYRTLENILVVEAVKVFRMPTSPTVLEYTQQGAKVHGLHPSTTTFL